MGKILCCSTAKRHAHASCDGYTCMIVADNILLTHVRLGEAIIIITCIFSSKNQYNKRTSILTQICEDQRIKN